jgi:3-oxoacyl-(acyl-carrier-protein) synthase III
MIPVRIVSSGLELPGPPIPTGEVAAVAFPHRDPEDLRARTGIERRHWVDDDTDVAALGARALRSALDRAGMRAADLRRIVLVNSTGGDRLVPPTSNLLMDALGIAGTCDCFDLNNACSGFLSAMDLAARSVATGIHPVAVVVSEIFSRHILPSNPRSYVVFGDVAVAVIFDRAADGEGLLGSYLANDPTLRGNASLRHTREGQAQGTIEFGRSSREMTESALGNLQRSAQVVLDAAGLSFSDLDWVLPHQPNGSMLRHIQERLDLRPEQVVPVVQDIGSVGAAAIPVSLHRLLEDHRPGPGEHVLLVSVGAGVSYGAMIYRTGHARG